MAKGAAWMVLFKLLERSIGLFSMLFLARILMPADFGLVSLATATIAILEVLGSFSFDIALIQRKESDRSHYDTAWTFNVIVGVLACLAVLLLAQPAASFYEDSRLKNLLYLLAFGPLVGSLENIGIVAFRKEMQFQKEFSFLIAKKLITTLLTLILAVTLRSYWSLAIGILIGRTTGTILSYQIHPFRPRLTLSKKNDLLGFSMWSFTTNILQFATNRIGDFVIGKTNGANALGIYNVGYEIANLPTTELVAPINRAVFSAYAKMNLEEMKKGYLLVLDTVAILAIPAALGIACLADIIVPTLLGKKWSETIPIMEILSFFGLIQALTSNIGSVYYALGIPKTITKYYCYYAAILIPGFFIGTHYFAAIGAASALLIAAFITALLNIDNTFRLLRINLKDFLLSIWRPCISGLIMLATVLYIKNELPFIYQLNNSLKKLFVMILTGIVIYVASISMLWIFWGKNDGPEARFLLKIKGFGIRKLDLTPK